MPIDGVSGFIIDIKTQEAIQFLYFQPIENSVSANYDMVSPRGRSEPYDFYIDTSADTYNFDIRLVASVDSNDGGLVTQVWEAYLFLKSFQYPEYGTAKVGPVLPPHHVILSIGSFFEKEGIIKNPSFTFNPPYDQTGRPQSIDCRFVFQAVNETPLSYLDVRRGR